MIGSLEDLWGTKNCKPGSWPPSIWKSKVSHFLDRGKWNDKISLLQCEGRCQRRIVLWKTSCSKWLLVIGQLQLERELISFCSPRPPGGSEAGLFLVLLLLPRSFLPPSPLHRSCESLILLSLQRCPAFSEAFSPSPELLLSQLILYTVFNLSFCGCYFCLSKWTTNVLGAKIFLNCLYIFFPQPITEGPRHKGLPQTNRLSVKEGRLYMKERAHGAVRNGWRAGNLRFSFTSRCLLSAYLQQIILTVHWLSSLIS